jgi:hypothetical protein
VARRSLACSPRHRARRLGEAEHPPFSLALSFTVPRFTLSLSHSRLLATEQSITAARSSTTPLLTPSQAPPSHPPRAPLRRALLAVPCTAALVTWPPTTRVAGAATTKGHCLHGRLASGHRGARQGCPRVLGCFAATSLTPVWPPFAANDEL